MHQDYPLADSKIRNLIICQGVLLVYFGLVLFHFFSFAIAKPKINNSLRELHYVRLKYMLIWPLLILVVFVAHAFAFTIIWPIDNYYSDWITVLKDM